MTKLQIYGTVFLFCAAAVITAPAQSVVFSTLASFNGSNGAYPYYMSLVQGSDGNFYGTTLAGGTNSSDLCPWGPACGTVFKIAPDGRLTTLYSFCSQPSCTDGANPWAELAPGRDGNFYGTTNNGGPTSNCSGCGTVFKITLAGVLTTLYNFCSQPNCTDGEAPEGALVQGSDGSFYGTTYYGGTYGYGTVFKISPVGSLTTLYSFCALSVCSDGELPLAGLVQASDGYLYGTTTGGGTNGNHGTVFKINPTAPPGQGMTLLYSFCGQPNCSDGNGPYAPLMQASDGNFYGTSAGGGVYGDGTVFKMTAQGTLTTLHNFQGYPTDGEWPTAGLVQGRDGNLYGTTFMAGVHNNGAVFKITTAGTLTLLHSFDSRDGAGPLGGLVQTPTGFFYGTTYGGGANNDGTVFSLLPVNECATCRP